MPTVNTSEMTIPAKGVRSLVWDGDELVDIAGGWARYLLDGTSERRVVHYAYTFDAAIATGEFAVIYTRLGTKALLLRDGKIVREINRSFHCANAFEYPVALAEHDGRTLLIHCPEHYNRLEIEDAETGERLTPRTSKQADFFHSRLTVAPNGRRLLSAGWVWHPLDAVAFFDVAEALRNPEHLDAIDWCAPRSRYVGLAEESSACWLSDTLAAIAGNAGTDSEVAEAGPDRLRPRGVIVFDTSSRKVLSSIVLEQPAGRMVPLGETHVVALYDHPRLIRLADGAVEAEWPAIRSGTPVGSIMTKDEQPPPIAFDRAHRRFAIAAEDGIHVITCGE